MEWKFELSELESRSGSGRSVVSVRPSGPPYRWSCRHLFVCPSFRSAQSVVRLSGPGLSGLSGPVLSGLSVWSVGLGQFVRPPVCQQSGQSVCLSGPSVRPFVRSFVRLSVRPFRSVCLSGYSILVYPSQFWSFGIPSTQCPTSACLYKPNHGICMKRMCARTRRLSSVHGYNVMVRFTTAQSQAAQIHFT